MSLGDNVSVAAGATGTVNLSGTEFSAAGVGTLTLNAGSSVAVTGDTSGSTRRLLRADATNLAGAGTYAFNTTLDVAPGRITGGGGAGVTINKLGSARLILDATDLALASDLAGVTFDVQAGSLYVLGSAATGAVNPLGTAAVRLNGGTLSLDTKNKDVTFANAVSLAPGASGTIEAVAGPRTFTLSNTAAINVDAGQSLTLSTYGGSVTVAGATLVLSGPLTGGGALVKTQTAVGGSLNGTVVLTADSPAFSGPVTVAAGGGILEGRFATAAARPFGTNPTLTLAGGQVNFRGGATPASTYALGTNVSVTGDATLDASSYGTGATTGTSTFALGALTTTGARTVGLAGANGYGFTFGPVTLGGNATFNATGGTHALGAISGGVAAITKAGAGTVQLAAVNDYTGGTTISGGVLVAPVLSDAGTAGSLGTSGDVTLSGGTLQYTGADAVTFATRTLNANNAAGGAIDLTNPAASLTVTSRFAGNAGSSVRKLGPGTLTLGGTPDNDSLALNVLAGTVNLDKGVTAGTRAVAGITGVAAGATVRLTGANTDQIYGGSQTGQNSAVNLTGGTFDLNGKSESFSRLTGVGTVTNNGPAAGTSTLTLGETNGTGTFSGAIKDGSAGGKTAVVKIGTGVLTLGGSNTYTGSTTISGGTIKLAAAVPVAGAGLWLDAADASTVTLAAGKVSAWADKSGNGRNAGQATAANQPGAYAANANVGGKNVVRFGGGTQVLTTDLSFLNGSAYSIFAVEGKSAAAGANNYFLGTSNPSGLTNQGLHFGYRTDTSYTLAQYGNDLTYTPAGGDPSLAFVPGAQTFRLWDGILNTGAGGGHSILLNGTQVASNTNTTALSGIPVGGGNIGQGFNTATPYTGDLGEILVYPTALSAADRQSVEAYLRYKWFGIGTGTPGPLPATTAVNITAAGAGLDLDSNNQTVGSLAGVAGSTVTLGSATLTVGDATNTTFAGAIGGAGGLAKQGAGTLTLSGANTYTGPTTVSAGTLLVNGSLAGGGATTVAGGGTIGGSGTLGGPLSIAAGGTVSPGNSPGTLTTGNLSLAAGSTALVEVAGTAAGSAYDQLVVAGSVALGGGNLQLALGYVPTVGDAYTLIDNDGSDPVAGAFATVNGSPVAGGTFTLNGVTFGLNYAGGTGNDVVLTALAVPEPATAALAVVAIGGLLARRRRRRA